MSDSSKAMARMQRQTVCATATNGNADASISAPTNPNQSIVIVSYGFSGSAAPLAAVQATLTEDPSGTPVVKKYHDVPAAAFAAWEVQCAPIVFSPGKAARLRLPALGASIVGSVNIGYYLDTP